MSHQGSLSVQPEPKHNKPLVPTPSPVASTSGVTPSPPTHVDVWSDFVSSHARDHLLIMVHNILGKCTPTPASPFPASFDQPAHLPLSRVPRSHLCHHLSYPIYHLIVVSHVPSQLHSVASSRHDLDPSNISILPTLQYHLHSRSSYNNLLLVPK